LEEQSSLGNWIVRSSWCGGRFSSHFFDELVLGSKSFERFFSWFEKFEEEERNMSLKISTKGTGTGTGTGNTSSIISTFNNAWSQFEFVVMVCGTFYLVQYVVHSTFDGSIFGLFQQVCGAGVSVEILI
jgi:hypothetical protein